MPLPPSTQILTNPSRALHACAAGTNFLIRATAFQEAGWSPEYTLTEDYALGMELTRLHWHCRYVNEYLAIGEAPHETRNCFQQRSRWCKVCACAAHPCAFSRCILVVQLLSLISFIKHDLHLLVPLLALYAVPACLLCAMLCLASSALLQVLCSVYTTSSSELWLPVQGHFQIVLNADHCPIFVPGLSLWKKLMYCSGVWAYVVGAITTPFFIVVPLITIWKGIFPIIVSWWAACERLLPCLTQLFCSPTFCPLKSHM